MGLSNSRLRSSSSSSCTRKKNGLLASLLCAASPVSDTPSDSLQIENHLLESSKRSFHENAVSSKQPLSSVVGIETGLTSSSTTENESSSSGTNNDTIVHTPEQYSLSSHSEIAELQQPPLSSANTTASSLVDQNPQNQSTGNANTDSYTATSGVPLTSQQLPGFMLFGGEQESRGASVLVVDMVSIHSNILSSSIADITNLEARRNSRRMNLDAFSRSSFRRTSDSPSVVITTNHADDLGSHDRWFLDFSGDLDYDGIDSESMFSARSHRRREQRRRSRYEALGRFHDVQEEHRQQSSLCAAGLHPHGTCSCESLFITEESIDRPNIPQIIILADALFEVLEEIHHQRMSLLPSMLSLPAPEAVVNSFPLKNYKRSCGTESGSHDMQQCNICLVDYEDGDKIRVLPCSHEYHMLCVDKWLKEIHRVCPLCRDDVCKGIGEGSAANPDI